VNATPWQLRIARKSLKKKEKIALIRDGISIGPDDVVLDLGCAQGILSHFLRQKGGTWVSTDLDFTNLKTSQALLGRNLIQTDASGLPFRGGAFDGVVCLDYLEHIDNDTGTLLEIRRVLKTGGRLVLVTPHTGPLFLLQKLRPVVGLKLEFYGHKRAGYTLPALGDKCAEAGLRVLRHRTYSRFFTELLELVLNAVYVNFLSTKPAARLRDGHIRPSTEDEFASQKKAFGLYRFLYPAVWLVSRLDTLLFFQRGNALVLWAEKI
jgi:SAM-dependent methyltransferase